MNSQNESVNRESDDIWSVFSIADEPVDSDGKPLWNAECPQPDCGAENCFAGDPKAFKSRPYRCMECNWVSAMHPEAIEELRVSHPEVDHE